MATHTMLSPSSSSALLFFPLLLLVSIIPLVVVTPVHSISLPAFVRPAKKLNFEDCAVNNECVSPRTCLTHTKAGEILPCSTVTDAQVCMCAPMKKIGECSFSEECSDGEHCAQIWFMKFATCVSCKSWLRLTRVLDTTGNSCASASRQSIADNVVSRITRIITREVSMAERNGKGIIVDVNERAQAELVPVPMSVRSIPADASRPGTRTVLETAAKKLNFEDCVADSECVSPRTCLTRTRAGEILPCSAVKDAPLCMCAPMKKVGECSSSDECSDGEHCAQIWFMSFATCVSCKSWLRLTRVLDTGNSCASSSRQSIADNTVSRSSNLVGGNKVNAIPLSFPVNWARPIARPAVRSTVTAKKFNFEDCVADSECASPRTCLTRTRAGQILPCAAVKDAPLCMCAPMKKVGECSSSDKCSDGEHCAQIWFMSFATCVSCKSWLRLTRVLDTSNSCASITPASRQSIADHAMSKITRSFIASSSTANTNTKNKVYSLPLPVNSVPSIVGLAAVRSAANAKKLNFEDCFADSECMSSRTCLTRTSAGQILPCSSIKPGSSICMCAPIAGVPPCSGSHQCSDGERCAQIWFMKFATCVSCKSWLRLTHSLDNGNCEAASSRQSVFIPITGTNSNALHAAGLSLLPGLVPSKSSVTSSLTSSPVTASSAFVSAKTPLSYNLGLTGDFCKQHGVVTTVCRPPRMCSAPHIHPSVQCRAADANCFCGSGASFKPATGCLSSTQCDHGERCVQHLLVRHGELTMCASCTSPFINGIFRPVDQYVCPTMV